METMSKSTQDDIPFRERLQLHVRCVPEEETVQLALPLPDGKGIINLNRPREDKIVNTLRRLSLTLKKRRLFIGDNELASGGQRAGSKKAKGGGGKARHTVVTAATAAAVAEPTTSQNGNGDAGNETVTLVERVTGKAIEVDGALNDDGWMRLCAREDSDAIPSSSAGTEGVSIKDKNNTECFGTSPTFIRIEKGGRTGLDIDVIVNPPGVTWLESSTSSPMTGFAILAQAETEFATGESWEWLRESPGDLQEEEDMRGMRSKTKGIKGAVGRGNRGGGFTQVVGTLAMYTPVEADIGRRLMIRCTPLRRGGLRGRPVVRLLAAPVRSAPEPGLLALRRRWLDDTIAGRYGGVAGEEAGGMRGGKAQVERRRRFRVVCYNILADMFCTSAHANEVLYPYCPKQFREADYRFQMVTREIRGYDADLIMLQECEVKTYEKILAPVLRHDGFEGLYLNKAGSTQEGEAMFYKRSVLELESRHDFAMRDAIPLQEDFKGLLKAFPFLLTMFETRLTTVAQIAVFRPASCADMGANDSPVRLIVANTHLYFHPDAAHIRLMQLVALMDRISGLQNDLIARGLRPGVVLGGDLNSPPDGPVQYLSGKLVGPDSDLWRNVDSFRWGNRFFDEVVTSDSTAPLERQLQEPTRLATPTMSEPSLLTSDNGVVVEDCGLDSTSANSYEPSGRPFLAGVPYLRLQLGLQLASGIPSFTNFTPEFTDTLDYVFIEGGGGSRKAAGQETPVVIVEKGGRGETEAIAPMPGEGALRAITPGLPSETFPSDHVSLVVDLSIMS